MYSGRMPLPDGRVARLVMPDLYDMLMSVGDAPSPEAAAVVQLLDGTGALPRQDLLQRLRASTEHYLRLYHVAALCMEWPRLVLVRRKCQDCGHTWDSATQQCVRCMARNSAVIHDRTADELSPKDLPFLMVQSIYLDFFLGGAAEIGPASANNPDGPAPAVRPGDDVQDDPQPVSAD